MTARVIFTPTTDKAADGFIAVSDAWFTGAFDALFGGSKLSEVLSHFATIADAAIVADENHEKHAMDRVRVMRNALQVASEWAARIEDLDESRGRDAVAEAAE